MFIDYLGYVHPYYSKFFLQLDEEEIMYVLDYLSSGKDCFPYEQITGFNSLSATPEGQDFWPIESFYSMLRDENISQKEWEGCKRLCKILRVRNLSDFNDICNTQDVIILAVILEYHWQKTKNDTGFDPRYFTSASTFSGANERIKCKVILTFASNVEIVDLMESLLRGGYSFVHTCLGLDTAMFTPKSKEYIEQKNNIIEKMRNVCGEPDEKNKRKN